MIGLEQLLMCGATIYSIGKYNKAAFLQALSDTARDSYFELGKWFFVEREQYLIFTSHGMRLVERSAQKKPDLVIPFLANLVAAIKADPLHTGLHEMLHMVKESYNLFGEDVDGSLACLLGQVWTLQVYTLQALPSKLVLDDNDASVHGKRYRLFLGDGETEAALSIFYQATRLTDTDLQLALFKYAEKSFQRLAEEYRELCPEDLPLINEVESMHEKSKLAVAKTKQILELEQKISILEAFQKQ